MQQWEQLGHGFCDTEKQQQAMLALLDSLKTLNGGSLPSRHDHARTRHLPRAAVEGPPMKPALWRAVLAPRTSVRALLIQRRSPTPCPTTSHGAAPAWTATPTKCPTDSTATRWNPPSTPQTTALPNPRPQK